MACKLYDLSSINVYTLSDNVSKYAHVVKDLYGVGGGKWGDTHTQKNVCTGS